MGNDIKMWSPVEISGLWVQQTDNDEMWTGCLNGARLVVRPTTEGKSVSVEPREGGPSVTLAIVYARKDRNGDAYWSGPWGRSATLMVFRNRYGGDGKPEYRLTVSSSRREEKTHQQSALPDQHVSKERDVGSAGDMPF